MFMAKPTPAHHWKHNRLFIIIIIIRRRIQEISIAKNPKLKARAQCAHRKKHNNYLYENQNTTEEQTEHTMTTVPWTIIQSMRRLKKSATAGQVESPKTTNCTSIHKHITNVDQNFIYYRC